MESMVLSRHGGLADESAPRAAVDQVGVMKQITIRDVRADHVHQFLHANKTGRLACQECSLTMPVLGFRPPPSGFTHQRWLRKLALNLDSRLPYEWEQDDDLLETVDTAERVSRCLRSIHSLWLSAAAIWNLRNQEQGLALAAWHIRDSIKEKRQRSENQAIAFG